MRLFKTPCATRLARRGGRKSRGAISPVVMVGGPERRHFHAPTGASRTAADDPALSTGDCFLPSRRRRPVKGWSARPTPPRAPGQDGKCQSPESPPRRSAAVHMGLPSASRMSAAGCGRGRGRPFPASVQARSFADACPCRHPPRGGPDSRGSARHCPGDLR